MNRKLSLLAAIIIILVVVFALQKNSQKPLSQETSPTVTPSPSSVEKTGGDQKMTFPDMNINVAKSYTAVLETNKGNITITLYTKEAPKTVNNFIFLAQKNFYDGTIFHRIIKDFMIQGGDQLGNGTGGPGYMFEDELNASLQFNKPGMLAMANRGPNTNGSQFFITTVETPWLDGKHTIFGYVTKGMDVVKAIENVEIGQSDKPVKDVVIKDVEILEDTN